MNLFAGPALSAPAFFLAGVAASPHCALMCGAVQWTQLRGHAPGWRPLSTLHLGRLAGYLVLGALAGTAGARIAALFSYAPFGRAAQLAAALLLVAAGLGLWRRTPACCAVRPAPPRTRGLWWRGLLWAAMPCGMLYTALAIAALGRSATSGALLLGAFALGTFPLLALFGTYVPSRARAALPRSAGRGAGALMVAAGLASAGAAWALPLAALPWCRG